MNNTNDRLDDVIQFYQHKYRISYTKSIFDIFCEFFQFDLTAIDVWMENHFKCKILKNDVTSDSYRKQGNSFFIKKKLKQSLQLYTKSLCYALPFSKQYTLALANRSAVIFEKQNFEDCLKDINTCLSSVNYPNNLRPKLLLRKADCLEKLKRPEEFALCLKEINDLFENISFVTRDTYIVKFNELKKLRVDNEQEKEKIVPTLCRANIDFEENLDFAFASSKIEMRHHIAKGRHVVAKKNISKGEVLFVEKAFSFSPIFDVETRNINTDICYHCLKHTDSAISCDFCVRCLYCDKVCKEQSWREYHNWECVGMQTDMWYYLGITLPAFKAFCKGINDAAIGERVDDNCFGNKINNYPYFDSLMYHIDQTNTATLICAAILIKYLSKYTNFFQWYLAKPSCPEKNLHSLQKYVGSCITKHILQLEINSTLIENWIDECSNLPTEKLPVACGIFPSVSIMNHSCRPNISNYFICDTIVVRAIDDIEKETEIYNCYGICSRTMRRDERQKRLLELYNFVCNCVVCSNPCEEMQVFDKFICKKCNCSIPDDVPKRFCYCANCKARIDLEQLREETAHLGTMMEGELSEDLLLYCFQIRRKFLSETHADLQSTCYQLYLFYRKKEEFCEVITYFECWLKNEKIRIGNSAQLLGQLLYEVGLSVVKSLKNVVNYSESQRYLLTKAATYLEEAKSICSLYYPSYLIDKMELNS